MRGIEGVGVLLILIATLLASVLFVYHAMYVYEGMGSEVVEKGKELREKVTSDMEILSVKSECYGTKILVRGVSGSVDINNATVIVNGEVKDAVLRWIKDEGKGGLLDEGDLVEFVVEGQEGEVEVEVVAREARVKWKGYIEYEGPFRYRRKITLTERSGNSLTEYQVRVDVPGWDPSKTEEGNDVRFYDPEYGELDYWIEDLGGGRFWVKVPKLEANETRDIYMCYGARGLPSKSDPEKTFLFFDHFDTLDTGTWYVSATDYTVSGSVLRINVGAIGLQNPLPYRLQDGYAVETNALFVALASGYSGTVPELSSSRFTQSGNAGADATVLYMRTSGSTIVDVWIGSGNTTGYDVSGGAPVFNSSDGVWYVTGVSVYGGTVRLWVDYTNPTTYTGISWGKDFRYFSLGAFSGSSTYDIQDTEYEWVRVRKYVEPEPGVSVGAEEVAG